MSRALRVLEACGVATIGVIIGYLGFAWVREVRRARAEAARWAAIRAKDSVHLHMSADTADFLNEVREASQRLGEAQ